jgi:hypothetical protein
MSVKIVKLIDGTEIVCAVSDVVDSYIPETPNSKLALEITKPLTLNIIPTERGIQLGFLPFSFGASPNQEIFELNKSLILSVFDPSDQIENAYREQTSGLVFAKSLPSNSPIVGV